MWCHNLRQDVSLSLVGQNTHKQKYNIFNCKVLIRNIKVKQKQWKIFDQLFYEAL